jgi:predicted cupin superfamily sugar epimerase
MPTAQELIARHGLQPHPEGGHYAEVHRAERRVAPVDEPAHVRRAYTTIHFLLEGHEYSAWHRVEADETWYFHEGDDLAIHEWHHDGSIVSHTVGRSCGRYQHTVLAGTWFAAEPIRSDGFAFVSCAVGPGFEFDDFTLMDAHTARTRLVRDERQRVLADRLVRR